MKRDCVPVRELLREPVDRRSAARTRSRARGRSSRSTRSDGHVIWTDSVNSLGYSTPAVGTDRIFVGDFNGGLRAYRQTNGQLLWRAHVGGRILGPPVVVGDLVFFSTLETETYACPRLGREDRLALRAREVLAGIATDRTYYFSLNGMLVAFRGKDGPRPARASSGSAPKTKMAKPRTRRG